MLFLECSYHLEDACYKTVYEQNIVIISSYERLFFQSKLDIRFAVWREIIFIEVFIYLQELFLSTWSFPRFSSFFRNVLTEANHRIRKFHIILVFRLPAYRLQLNIQPLLLGPCSRYACVQLWAIDIYPKLPLKLTKDEGHKKRS